MMVGDQYDVLAKLLRSRRNLLEAGAKGEPVAYQLQDVENRIGAEWDRRTFK